ncbi:MAG: hypothetical protein H6735_16310 [Alphaproteobacteria bacterium]|nr:hypothetical protein [Alphaproteobacteria bacterium]
MVVFSGYTQPWPGSGNPDDADIVAQLNAAGVAGIFELVKKGTSKVGDRRPAYFVKGKGERPMGPFHQRFARCFEATPSAVRTLVDQLRPGGARRFQLGECNVALLICGEDNIVEQPRGGAVRGRHGALATPPTCNVLLDPRHTVSRRHEHRSRVNWFSSAGPDRFAVAHANYGPGQERYAHLFFLARGGVSIEPHVHWDTGFYGFTFDVPVAEAEDSHPRQSPG